MTDSIWIDTNSGTWGDCTSLQLVNLLPMEIDDLRVLTDLAEASDAEIIEFGLEHGQDAERTVQALDTIAALLGSRETWDSPADLLEQIADLIGASGRYHPGDGSKNSTTHYTYQAQCLGLA